MSISVFIGYCETIRLAYVDQYWATLYAFTLADGTLIRAFLLMPLNTFVPGIVGGFTGFIM